MTLYNVTAELGGDPRPRSSSDAESDAVADSMPDELVGPFSAVLHASEHHDDGLAITLSLDSFGPGMAANMAADVLRAFGFEVDAVHAMTSEEFDRRNGLD